MADLVLKGGRVVDATGSRVADVVVGDDGRIVAVGADLHADQVLDASGCVVAPGLVDLHTHLRQPGREEAETVESGSRAAALGGYTAVVAMPNTEPAIDCAAVVHEVLDLGAKAALCDVRVAGAITVGRAGDRLAPIAEMAAARRAAVHRRRARRARCGADAPCARVRRRPRRDLGAAL